MVANASDASGDAQQLTCNRRTPFLDIVAAEEDDTRSAGSTTAQNSEQMDGNGDGGVGNERQEGRKTEHDGDEEEDDEDWEKILWRRQPYPDNYVPKSFLSSRRRNETHPPHTYAPILCSALPVAQHISAIFGFLPIFIHLYRRNWDARLVTCASIFVFMLGYIFWEAMECTVFDRKVAKGQRQTAAKSTVLVFFFLLALSPILRTLTAATSSDSIWALAACLFILNIVLADYAPAPRSARRGGQQERLTAVLSMNSAVAASVVLASRLNSDASVFALMLSAIEIFVLFPLLRTRLQHTPVVVQFFLTSLLCFLAIHLMLSVSTFVGALLSVILMFVTFGAPAVLVWSQRYKNEIRGPWDVAVPRVQTPLEI